ncbi:hypothetical protein F0919_07660 [Taibaiella lutea]|uniref:Uncharacterized protein n=1 Tax=Taibaiella lutea TaxID=2608001 RepID=A0A5M6CMW9_9BACT|nr:hypothetical protein [Taibaiella lutea]KAA5534489.1 hypothetical protein F0919_07660 [Taibaiella lutea]
MQYQSIIRFFDFSGIEYDNVGGFNLSRAKKLVTAEFAMQADGIIVVDGCSYTKQEILAELERRDFSERLQFHKIIWENKGLLAFLEEDRFDFHDGGNWYSLSDMPGFVSFVSPYFSVVYNRIMRSFLNNNDLAAAADWLDYLFFIEAEDEEEALRNTRMYLNDVVRFFRNLNDASYKSRDKELRLWYTTSWSNFINKLPDSLLSYVDEIVSAIINFTVRIQKSGKKICYKISKELLNVTNANYSLLQLIRSNHEAYAQNYKGKTFTGWLKSGVNIVYVIMIVIFAVSKLFLSDSDDSGYNFLDNKVVDKSISEVQRYKNARDYYRTNYGSREFVFNPERNAGGPFDDKNVYLLVEGVKDSAKALTPFSIKNNTRNTIQLYVLRADNVYYFDLAPLEFLSFAPLYNQSVDIILKFDNEGDTFTIPSDSLNEMQFLHVGSLGQEHDTAYVFNDTTNIDMPYLEEAELLQKAPLVIDIRRKEGAFYFQLKGRGNVIYEKGKDAGVTMK